MEYIVEFVIFLVMLAAGYFWGTRAEKKHYRSIAKREKTHADILLIATKHPPFGAQDSELVLGSVVIANDYFKNFVAGLVGMFGGRINVYESLLDRARREAILRMKEEARERGANMIVNMKFETATLNSIQLKQAAMVEVLAYGTAVKHQQSN